MMDFEDRLGNIRFHLLAAWNEAKTNIDEIRDELKQHDACWSDEIEYLSSVKQEIGDIAAKLQHRFVDIRKAKLGKI